MYVLATSALQTSSFDGHAKAPTVSVLQKALLSYLRNYNTSFQLILELPFSILLNISHKF